MPYKKRRCAPQPSISSTVSQLVVPSDMKPSLRTTYNFNTTTTPPQIRETECLHLDNNTFVSQSRILVFLYMLFTNHTPESMSQRLEVKLRIGVLDEFLNAFLAIHDKESGEDNAPLYLNHQRAFTKVCAFLYGISLTIRNWCCQSGRDGMGTFCSIYPMDHSISTGEVVYDAQVKVVIDVAHLINREPGTRMKLFRSASLQSWEG